MATRQQSVMVTRREQMFFRLTAEETLRLSRFGSERAFAAGDPIRRVNWRVSSRRQQLHVTVAADERAVDLVLVVDALSDVGEPPDSSLDRAVRTAAGMAELLRNPIYNCYLVRFRGFADEETVEAPWRHRRRRLPFESS